MSENAMVIGCVIIFALCIACMIYGFLGIIKQLDSTPTASKGGGSSSINAGANTII